MIIYTLNRPDSYEITMSDIAAENDRIKPILCLFVGLNEGCVVMSLRLHEMLTVAQEPLTTTLMVSDVGSVYPKTTE